MKGSDSCNKLISISWATQGGGLPPESTPAAHDMLDTSEVTYTIQS